MRTSWSPRRRALAATILALGMVTGASAGPAMAAPSDVDPSTLTPAPPDFFNAECREAGRQILCDLAFTDPVMPVDEPTGILCESPAGPFEVLDTSIRTVRGIRYYSADGLLERRHFSDRIEGTLTNSLTGSTVPYVQHTTYLHDLAVPGDATTGSEEQTTHMRLQTRTGAVFITAGRAIVSLQEEATTFRAGQHPLDEYFEDGDVHALDPLCEALS